MKKRLLTVLLLVGIIMTMIPTGAVAASPFTDVPADAEYAEYVTYAYEHGFMDGMGGGKFEPAGTLTRGQIVTILYRIEGEPAVSGTSFSDVPAGQWFTKGVTWAASKGIVDGYGGGKFGPTDKLTREQMALILHRYAGFKGYSTSLTMSLAEFTDGANVHDYALTAVRWAAAENLIYATDKKLNATGNATRADAAVAISRFDQNVSTNPTDPVTPTDPTTPETPVVTTSNVATKSYRMFPYYWLEDGAFADTCAGLRKYADCIDEVTLFCDYMHQTYMTDAMISQYSSILTKRIATLKSMGFKSVGINMLQTVSHGDYPVYLMPNMPFASAVDYQGNTSLSQPCPRTTAFRDYITKKYTAYAKTGADFIWVDDDFRVPDKTVSYTCFCDSCVSGFNKKYGTSYSRISLATELGAAGDSYAALRRRWSQYNLSTYEDLMTLIKNTVAKVDPGIKLGLMTVHLPAEEYLLSDYTGMLSALGAVKTRPGGGFHNESNAMEFLTKSYGIAGQIAQTKAIPDRQYELEDWPQNYNKSARMHITECTAALMAGCNGIAFASVPPDQGNDDVMTAIRGAKNMWNDMVKVGDGWKLYGGTALYDAEYGLYANDSRYFSIAAHGFYNVELTPFTYGFMPFTPYQENSCITVITEDMANSLSDAELKTILSKGVMMDGGAANMLNNRGYGAYIGVETIKWERNDVEERYTSASLNGSAAGTIRYTYGTSLYTFGMRSGAIGLANLETPLGLMGGTTSFVYENSLGGRVAVFGFMPWDYFGMWQRIEQTNNVVEWLSKGKNPVKIMNDDRVASYIKQPADRSKFMLMLVDATLDNTVSNLKVRVLGEFKGTMYYYGEDGVRKTLSASSISVGGGYTTLTLPSIAAWGFCVVYTA